MPLPLASALEAEIPTQAQRQTAEPSLRANVAWALAGNTVYAVSQWGVLSAIAKLGTPEMVGLFALGMAVTAPIIIFSNLNLRTAQATDARHEYLFGDYLGVRIAATVVALIVIAVAAFGLYDKQAGPVIVVIGLAKGIESCSDVFYGLLLQHERLNRIAISMMLKGPLSLLVLALLLWKTHSILAGTIGLAFVWGLLFLTYDLRSGLVVLSQSAGSERITPRWNADALRRLVMLTLPLGFSAMLVSLTANIPRYFIDRYAGAQALGIFAAMAYLMQAGNVIINAIAQSVSPRLARHYALRELRSFGQLLGRLLWMGVGLGLGGVVVAAVAGRPILTILYRLEYSERTDVFIWVMAATGLGYVASFLGYGLSATRHFRIQPVILAFEVALGIVVCYLLVPSFGILGATWAMCVMLAFQVVAMLVATLYALYAASNPVAAE